MRPGTTTPHPDGFVPLVGQEPIPGYRLIRARGHGGFATVWESESPDGDRVALKFMSTQNASSTARELRSLQAIQTLDHPNLLRIRQVWSLPGVIVIGMDLADASMLDLLELYAEEFGKLLEPEKLCQYLYQVAEALDFLNAKKHKIDGRICGLQHGDIKPNNILLVGDKAKLADYGLATPTLGPVTPCPRQGTVEYCAPEVFAGYQSERSDQFSFAVTYYMLRTGSFPFPQPPPPGPALKNYTRPEPDVSAVTPGEQAALVKALGPIPQTRFRTCCEFMHAILTSLRLRAEKSDSGAIKIVPVPTSVPEPGSRAIKIT